MPRSADARTIRRAFRRRAKDTHPDTGGDPKAFARVKRASLVLLDPARRQKYDTTGQIDDDSPDNALSIVMQFVAAALGEVVGEAVSQGHAPEHVDLIASAAAKLRKKQAALAQAETDHNRGLDYLRRAAARVTVKPGQQNRVAALIRGQISMVEQTMQNAARQRLAITDALAVLADHQFTVDRPTATIPPPPPMFRMFGL